MVFSKPPKVRLAPQATPGAEMYNYYQLVSLLSSLYVKSLDRGDDEDCASAWDACALSILEQIGLAHVCWDQVQAQVATGLPLPVNVAVVKRTFTIAKRMVILERHLTEWTPALRWSRMLEAMERSILKVGMRVGDHHVELKQQLQAMIPLVSARQTLLKKIQKAALEEGKHLMLHFAEPVSL